MYQILWHSFPKIDDCFSAAIQYYFISWTYPASLSAVLNHWIPDKNYSTDQVDLQHYLEAHKNQLDVFRTILQHSMNPHVSALPGSFGKHSWQIHANCMIHPQAPKKKQICWCDHLTRFIYVCALSIYINMFSATCLCFVYKDHSRSMMDVTDSG